MQASLRLATARLVLLCAAVIAGLALFSLTLSSQPSGPNCSQPHATTITVTNTNDSGISSLRQALIAAQNGDTIQFDPALNGQTIILTSGELLINKSITINGPRIEPLNHQKRWCRSRLSAFSYPRHRHGCDSRAHSHRRLFYQRGRYI